MRRLIVLLLAGFAAASHAFTEQIRVTTWNLSLPPGGSTASAPAGTEEKRLREAAAVLKSFDADVILLQDVRDRQFCNRLACLSNCWKILIDYQAAKRTLVLYRSINT